MERRNEPRIYQPGERFSIIDLNTWKIPRTALPQEPLVIQLRPRVIPAAVTRVELAHDSETDHFWQKVFLQPKNNPRRRGSTFEMHTKRRLQEGIYANRFWLYLFVHQSVDPPVVREVLDNFDFLNFRPTDTNLPEMIIEQLTAISESVK